MDVFISFTVELGKRIFATVKPRFTSTELIIQYSYLHSNAVLNIKMYSCISLGPKITQIKIPGNVVDDWEINNMTSYEDFQFKT